MAKKRSDDEPQNSLAPSVCDVLTQDNPSTPRSHEASTTSLTEGSSPPEIKTIVLPKPLKKQFQSLKKVKNPEEVLESFLTLVPPDQPWECKDDKLLLPILTLLDDITPEQLSSDPKLADLALDSAALCVWNATQYQTLDKLKSVAGIVACAAHEDIGDRAFEFMAAMFSPPVPVPDAKRAKVTSVVGLLLMPSLADLTTDTARFFALAPLIVGDFHNFMVSHQVSTVLMTLRDDIITSIASASEPGPTLIHALDCLATILLVPTQSAVRAVQDAGLRSGLFLHVFRWAIQDEGNDTRTAARRTLGLMIDHNSDAKAALGQLLPPTLVQLAHRVVSTIDRRWIPSPPGDRKLKALTAVDQKDKKAMKKSVKGLAALDFEDSVLFSTFARGRWDLMWSYYDATVEVPVLYWSEEVRAELREAIDAELDDLRNVGTVGLTWSPGSLALNIPTITRTPTAGKYLLPQLLGPVHDAAGGSTTLELTDTPRVVADVWRHIVRGTAPLDDAIPLLSSLSKIHPKETEQILLGSSAECFLGDLIGSGRVTPPTLVPLLALLETVLRKGTYIEASRLVYNGVAPALIRLIADITEPATTPIQTIAMRCVSVILTIAPRTAHQFITQELLGLMSAGMAIAHPATVDALLLFIKYARKPDHIADIVSTGAHLFALAQSSPVTDTATLLIELSKSSIKHGLPDPLAPLLPLPVRLALARAPDAFISMMAEADMARADLVWGEEQKASLERYTEAAVGEYVRQARAGTTRQTAAEFIAGIPEVPETLYPTLSGKLLLGGLYVDDFNADPTVNLFDGTRTFKALDTELLAAFEVDPAPIPTLVGGLIALTNLQRYAPHHAVDACLAALTHADPDVAAAGAGLADAISSTDAGLAALTTAGVVPRLLHSLADLAGSPRPPPTLAPVLSALLRFVTARCVGTTQQDAADTILEAIVQLATPGRWAMDTEIGIQAINSLVRAADVIAMNTSSCPASAIAKGVYVALMAIITRDVAESTDAGQDEEGVGSKPTVITHIETDIKARQAAAALLLKLRRADRDLTHAIAELFTPGIARLLDDPSRFITTVTGAAVTHPRMLWTSAMRGRVHGVMVDALETLAPPCPDLAAMTLPHPELEGVLVVNDVFIEAYLAHPDQLELGPGEAGTLVAALVDRAAEAGKKADFAPTPAQDVPRLTLAAVRQLWKTGLGTTQVDADAMIDLLLSCPTVAADIAETLSYGVVKGVVADHGHVRDRLMKPMLEAHDTLPYVAKIVAVMATKSCDTVLLDSGFLVPFLHAAVSTAAVEPWIAIVATIRASPKASEQLSHLLAPRLVEAAMAPSDAALADAADRMASLFHGDSFEPTHVWHDAARDDVVAFVKEQVDAATKAGIKFKWQWKTINKSFIRTSLDGELSVGGIYLRAFNRSPLFSVDAAGVLGDILKQLKIDDGLLAAASKEDVDKKGKSTPRSDDAREQTVLQLSTHIAVMLDSVKILLDQNQHLMKQAWPIMHIAIRISLNASIATNTIAADADPRPTHLAGLFALRKSSIELLSQLCADTYLANMVLKNQAVRYLLAMIAVLTGDELVSAVGVIRVLVSRVPEIATQATLAGAPVFLLSVALSPTLDRSRRLSSTEALAIIVAKSDDMKHAISKLLTADADFVFQKSPAAVLDFLESPSMMKGEHWNVQRADKLIVALRAPLEELVYSSAMPWKGSAARWSLEDIMPQIEWEEGYTLQVLAQPEPEEEETGEDGGRDDVSEIEYGTPGTLAKRDVDEV